MQTVTALVTRLRTWFKDVNAVSAIDLMDEAADRIESDARQISVLIEECQKLKDRCVNGERERWIPVGERLPPHGVQVFVAMATGLEVMRWREDAGMWEWWDGDIDDLNVTHWMPLPEPPEVK